MDSKSVRELILKEVADWDDEVVATARFKAFSGQRSDWESKYLFWKDLIIKIARHFGQLFLRPSQVKNEWFSRGGLNPLCIDDVLFLMYNEGDLLRKNDLVDPTSGRLAQVIRKVRNLMVSISSSPQVLSEDCFVLYAVLKDKANEVLKLLSESHWNSSCITTMRKFGDMCGGLDEASVVLKFLAGSGKAHYLSVNKTELLEGVKLSLSNAAVSSITSLDCDVLYLIWTTEKLQQQLDVIDQRYEMSRKRALASLHSGYRKVALRHAKEMRLANENREKCSLLLNRVEEVLGVIANAESTKEVSEAIRIGAHAIKENKISVEEVDLCLSDLQESIDSQKQVEKALEDTPSYVDFEGEDVEEEFRKLELELGNEEPQFPTARVEASNVNVKGEEEISEVTEFINDALSNLKLSDNPSGKSASQNLTLLRGQDEPKKCELEAA